MTAINPRYAFAFEKVCNAHDRLASPTGHAYRRIMHAAREITALITLEQLPLGRARELHAAIVRQFPEGVPMEVRARQMSKIARRRFADTLCSLRRVVTRAYYGFSD